MNDERIQIRDMSESDIAATQDVTVSAYMQYAEVMPEWAWEEYRNDMISTIAGKEPPVEKIVADQGGTIVGSVVLIPAGTSFRGADDEEYTFQWPEVRLLAVPPSSRGRGVGALLLEECIRRARASGSDTITLHTAEMMQVAKQMYERRGFVRMPEIDFNPAPEVVIMGYRLDL